MSDIVRRKGKKNRKHGRMKKKPAYKRYLAEDRRNKNAARKLRRYMKKFPNFKPTIPDRIRRYM